MLLHRLPPSSRARCSSYAAASPRPSLFCCSCVSLKMRLHLLLPREPPQAILCESMGVPNYPIGAGATRFSKGVVGALRVGEQDITTPEGGWTMRKVRKVRKVPGSTH